jgi:hypothetical protein
MKFSITIDTDCVTNELNYGFNQFRGRDGFEDTPLESKAKATQIRGQGQDQTSSRPRPDRFEARPRPKLM